VLKSVLLSIQKLLTEKIFNISRDSSIAKLT